MPAEPDSSPHTPRSHRSMIGAKATLLRSAYVSPHQSIGDVKVLVSDRGIGVALGRCVGPPPAARGRESMSAQPPRSGSRRASRTRSSVGARTRTLALSHSASLPSTPSCESVRSLPQASACCSSRIQQAHPPGTITLGRSWLPCRVLSPTASPLRWPSSSTGSSCRSLGSTQSTC